MIETPNPPQRVECVTTASSTPVVDGKYIIGSDSSLARTHCAWKFPASMYFDCPYVRGWSLPVTMPPPCTDYDRDFPPLGYRRPIARTAPGSVRGSNIDDAWEVRPITHLRAQLLYTSIRTEKFRAGYGTRNYMMAPLLMARYRHRKSLLVGIELNPGPVDDGPEVTIDPPPANPDAIDIDGIPVVVRPRQPNSPHNFVPNISRALRYAHRAIAFMESRRATIIVAECRNQQEVVNVTVLLALLRQFITDVRYERSYFRCLGILGRTLRQPHLISARTRAFVESMLLRSGIEPNPGPPHRRPKVGKPPGVNRQAQRQQRTRAGIRRADDMRRGDEDARRDYDRDYPPLGALRAPARRDDNQCPWPVTALAPAATHAAGIELHGPSEMVVAPPPPEVAPQPPPPAFVAPPAEPTLQRSVADYIARESLAVDYEGPSTASRVARPFLGGRACTVHESGGPELMPIEDFVPNREICSTFRVMTRLHQRGCFLPEIVPLRTWVITDRYVDNLPPVYTGRGAIFPDPRPLSFRSSPICEHRPHTVEALLYTHENQCRDFFASCVFYCSVVILAYLPLLLGSAIVQWFVISGLTASTAEPIATNFTFMPGFNVSVPDFDAVVNVAKRPRDIAATMQLVRRWGYIFGGLLVVALIVAVVTMPILGALVRALGIKVFAERRRVRINKTALQDLMFKKPFSDYRSNMDYLTRLVSAAWDASDPSVLHYTALAAADYAQYMRDELLKSAPELGGH